MRATLSKLKREFMRRVSPPSLAAAQVAMPRGNATLSISRFAYCLGFVSLQGWVHQAGHRVKAVSFRVGDQRIPIQAINLPSPGAPDPHCGFEAGFDTGIGAHQFTSPALHVQFDDGSEHLFTELGIPEILSDRGHRMFPEFCERLKTMPPGRLLEIGSRARSGISRRDAAPAGWDYVGMDILEGPNVDVVGDAHRLSQLLPHASFDAAMSLAVFEHLAMPWKVALELNRVLKPGAIAFIQTHQSFPMHEVPWDFWRISADAWPALFNAQTGFRIIEAGMAEPLMFVARRWHPGVNYHESPGYAVSSVLVEKTSESSLSWDVDLDGIRGDAYPH